jgi:hypothetical protein
MEEGFFKLPPMDEFCAHDKSGHITWQICSSRVLAHIQWRKEGNLKTKETEKGGEPEKGKTKFNVRKNSYLDLRGMIDLFPRSTR